MEHGFLDKYATINSHVHNLNPRIKVILIFGLVFTTALIQIGKWRALLLLTVFAVLLMIISKLPLKIILIRLLTAAPIIFILSLTYALTSEVLSFPYSLMFVFLKSLTCVGFLVVLVSTIRFDLLLRTLRYFGLPNSVTVVLSFFYRYVFVIQDELERMLRAKSARLIEPSNKQRLKMLYTLVGMLLLRSFERSERIYRSMQAKGFSGKIPRARAVPMKLNDYLATTLFLLVIITTFSMNWMF